MTDQQNGTATYALATLLDDVTPLDYFDRPEFRLEDATSKEARPALVLKEH